jgi:5-methylcytosine-specific restriction endonuclease McrA
MGYSKNWTLEIQRNYWKNKKDHYNKLRRERYKNDLEFRESRKIAGKKYKRKPSKRQIKLRFQILHRDNFTCVYCGRKAPNVILHVDHVVPKSKSGKSTADNLVTACLECNIGKSDTLI